MKPLFLWTVFIFLVCSFGRAIRSVAYDDRSFILDGNRTLIASGSVHYQRVLPADWPRVLALVVELGFNTVQTYTLTDEHSPAKGVYDFSGRNNISAFVALAQSFNLNVIVRAGPYVCGEHFNGGVPLWMRGSSSGAQCFRCSDPVWEAFSVAYLAAVVDELKSSNSLWTQGGPVMALQVENEYNGPDQAYLNFVTAAARNLTTDVPWFLCHDLEMCSAANKAAGAAICSINGFWEDGSTEGVSQPSPAFVAGQRAANPSQPLMWTEDQGWFDQWGVGQRMRLTSDILYGVSRWLAFGGSYHNFYMITGGSNFGYSAADAVTTAYAPDTAIDYLLLRHEPKFSTYAAFHKAVSGITDALLAAPVATPSKIGAHCEIVTYGNIAFISNLGTNASATEIISFSGASLTVPNHTVIILNVGAVVFNTSAASDYAASVPQRPAVHARSAVPPTWTTIAELIGFGNSSAVPTAGSPPLEQLALTQNLVDYMYYELTPPSPVQAMSLNVDTCGGEYVYVFVAGASLPHAAASPNAARSSHEFLLTRREKAVSIDRIHILVSAMGLSTSPQPSSCKGLKKVVADKKLDLTNLGWESRWVFAGEAGRYFSPQGASSAPWAPVAASGGTVVTSWFSTHIDLPAPPLPLQNASTPPPQLAFALDLLGATKGVVWVNGVNLGRYNLELGVCKGPCAPPVHGGQCYIFWRNCGLPTQRYYHVPSSLLQPTDNLVVLFEETNEVPVSGSGPAMPSPPPRAVGHRSSTQRDLSKVSLVALVAHPDE